MAAEIRRLRAENETLLKVKQDLETEMRRMFWAQILISVMGLVTITMELYAHRIRS